MKDAETTVEQLKRMLRAGVEHHRDLVLNVELTLSFLSGNQWVMARRDSGIVPVENSAREYRCTENMMLPLFQWRQATLFKERPVLTCFAGGDEQSDDEKAFIASKLFDYWRSNSSWLDAEKEASKWVDVSGAAFIAPVWRKNPFRPLERKEYVWVEEGIIDGEKTTYIQEKNTDAYDYEMSFDVYNILNTFCFPLNANKFEKVTGILTAELASFDWLESHLGKKLTKEELTPINPSEINFDMLDRVNSFISEDFSLRLINGVEQEPLYLLLKYRERPSFKHKKGRYVCIVGDKIITDTELPYIDEARQIDPNDDLNLTMGLIPWFAGTSIPGRLIPPAPMELLRGIQVELNDLLTDQKANRKTVGRNKIIAEQGTINKDAFTDEHGEIVEIESGSTPPVIMAGKELSGIEREIIQKRSSFDDISGRNQLFHGNNPTQVRSAFHLDILSEEGSVIIDMETRIRELVHERVGKLALAIARYRISPNKLIEIVGRDSAGYALSFLENGNVPLDLRVKEGSAKARNHAAYEAQLVELLRLGAFNDPSGKPNTDKFWRMSRLGTLNMNCTQEAKIRTRAQNENQMMIHFLKPILPQEWEDHYLHIEEHRDYMNRSEFYAAKPAIKALFKAHIDTHRNMLTSQIIPDTTENNLPPGVVENAVKTAVKPNSERGM